MFQLDSGDLVSSSSPRRDWKCRVMPTVLPVSRRVNSNTRYLELYNTYRHVDVKTHADSHTHLGRQYWTPPHFESYSIHIRKLLEGLMVAEYRAVNVWQHKQHSEHDRQTQIVCFAEYSHSGVSCILYPISVLEQWHIQDITAVHLSVKWICWVQNISLLFYQIKDVRSIVFNMLNAVNSLSHKDISQVKHIGRF